MNTNIQTFIRSWPVVLAVIAFIAGYTTLTSTVSDLDEAIKKIEVVKADVTFVKSELELLKLAQDNKDSYQDFRLESLEEMKQNVKTIEANIRKIMVKLNIKED